MVSALYCVSHDDGHHAMHDSYIAPVDQTVMYSTCYCLVTTVSFFNQSMPYQSMSKNNKTNHMNAFLILNQ